MLKHSSEASLGRGLQNEGREPNMSKEKEKGDEGDTIRWENKGPIVSAQ